MQLAEEVICIVTHACSQIEYLGAVRDVVLASRVEHSLDTPGVRIHLDDPTAVAYALVHGSKGQKDLLPGVVVGRVLRIVEAVNIIRTASLF